MARRYGSLKGVTILREKLREKLGGARDGYLFPWVCMGARGHLLV
jgi:hypothetical protein